MTEDLQPKCEACSTCRSSTPTRSLSDGLCPNCQPRRDLTLLSADEKSIVRLLRTHTVKNAHGSENPIYEVAARGIEAGAHHEH